MIDINAYTPVTARKVAIVATFLKINLTFNMLQKFCLKLKFIMLCQMLTAKVLVIWSQM